MTAVAATSADTALLRVENLRVRYRVSGGEVTAVDDVSLAVRAGETVGLVGESGCGKSTLGRAILRLVTPDEGRITFGGRDILAATGAELRALRRELQVVFQDPRGSLDPRMRVRDIVAEPLAVHGVGSREERRSRADDMLERVGLDRALGRRRPTELSGGQQQRVGIGRALITNPRLVVCDEPVSALDVSVQAQVINLLEQLRESTGVAYLFIAHNLAVVRHLSDRVAVMYLGRIVESGPSHQVFARPLHPYTQGLLASALRVDRDAPSRVDVAGKLVAGDVPSPVDRPTGCAFNTRCPFVVDRCRVEQPELVRAEGEHAVDHAVACHRWDEIAPVPVSVRAR